MHRFYIDRIDGKRASISDAGQFHHLKDVLRLKVDDAITVFDREGNEYSGTITTIERKRALIKVADLKSTRRSEMKLTIACAVPKGNHMDDIVDQLTQLEVERIIPMETKRVVVKLNEAKKEARLTRWRKIAQNAAGQSQRKSIPIIEAVTGVTDVINRSQGFDLKLIPHLEGERKPLKDVLAKSGGKSIIVLIGPEGDFTPVEVGLALKVGFIPVSLGNTVLRVATAAVAVASYIKFALGT